MNNKEEKYNKIYKNIIKKYIIQSFIDTSYSEINKATIQDITITITNKKNQKNTTMKFRLLSNYAPHIFTLPVQSEFEKLTTCMTWMKKGLWRRKMGGKLHTYFLPLSSIEGIFYPSTESEDTIYSIVMSYLPLLTPFLEYIDRLKPVMSWWDLRQLKKYVF